MIRTRFAPSPTGYLHLGGARTALFNWAYARRHGGRFILRVEDTDLERSTQESVQAIFDAMRWLDLDWDEDVYFQMKRLARYKDAAEQLLSKGLAYWAYETKEELDPNNIEERLRVLRTKLDLLGLRNTAPYEMPEMFNEALDNCRPALIDHLDDD